MKKHVFLDLEETIIDSWHNRTLCNTERILSLISELGVTEIHIFSFAIDNETDKEIFESVDFKGQLETELGVKIVSNPSSEEIMKVCMKHTGNFFELFEFKSVWGKMRSFHDFCNASFVNAECILIDDAVQNTTFINHDANLIIKTLHI